MSEPDVMSTTRSLKSPSRAQAGGSPPSRAPPSSHAMVQYTLFVWVTCALPSSVE
jgi:hypothetical protein